MNIRCTKGAPLKYTNDLFKTLIDNFFEVLIIADQNGVVSFTNSSIKHVLGYLPEEVIGIQLSDLMRASGAKTMAQLLKISVNSKGSEIFYPTIAEIEFLHKDTSSRIIESSFKWFDTPSMRGTAISGRDITKRKQEENRRSVQNQIIEMIAIGISLVEVLQNLIKLIEAQTHQLRFSIMLIDEDGVHMRHAAGLDLPAGGLKAINSATVCSKRPILVTDISTDPLGMPYRELTENYTLSSCYASPILSSDGNSIGILDIFLPDNRAPDPIELAWISVATKTAGIAIMRMKSKERMYYLAYHDALTGLPNRVLLHDRLTQAVMHARRIKGNAAVLFIDLDKFKHINDTLGHDIGDRLLQLVSLRLQQCMRKDDSLARLGGNEFVLTLMAPADHHSAAQVAQKILEIMRPPVVVEDHELHVSCSIGISLYPNDGTNADCLLRNADIAMYHAKSNGCNGYQYFRHNLNAAAQKKHTLARQLHQAVSRQEFSLDYQCQVNMYNGRIFALEALLRWNKPGESIAPNEFIPIAEESGLILPIGEWVLRESCRQLKQWMDNGHPDLHLSVNVSARQILQPGLIELIKQTLKETGLPPWTLNLEISENMLTAPFEEKLQVLNKLCDLGVRLALDNFGTGNSSLSHLHKFPLSTLKIDQVFVHGIGHDQNDMAITNAIIAMANTLNMSVIAEGVETMEQATFLLDHGCLSAQGFTTVAPLPPLKLPNCCINTSKLAAFDKDQSNVG